MLMAVAPDTASTIASLSFAVRSFSRSKLVKGGQRSSPQIAPLGDHESPPAATCCVSDGLRNQWRHRSCRMTDFQVVEKEEGLHPAFSRNSAMWRKHLSWSAVRIQGWSAKVRLADR